jgi:hypothetical protein
MYYYQFDLEGKDILAVEETDRWIEEDIERFFGCIYGAGMVCMLCGYKTIVRGRLTKAIGVACTHDSMIENGRYSSAMQSIGWGSLEAS